MEVQKNRSITLRLQEKTVVITARWQNITIGITVGLQKVALGITSVLHWDITPRLQGLLRIIGITVGLLGSLWY